MTTNDSVQMRACVLREPGAVATETVSLAAPRAGEVRVRIAAAGVCHSDLHLADGKLGDGRWPIVLGHEGAGVVDAVGEGVDASDARRSRRAGDGRPVRTVRPLPGRSPDVVRAGRRPRVRRGPGRRQLASDRRRRRARCSTASASPASPSTRSSPSRPRSRSRPELPLWQASLLGCGVVTGFGAVNHAARVGIGERVCVVGCGGVGMQAIAAARLAGAAQIIAVDLRAEKLDHALRRGATHTVLADGDDPAAEIRSLSGGGVDHAFEVVGAPATIRLAWDALRPGGTAVVVGLAPVGVEVGLPAIEFLSEKRIIGSYYGSADPALSLRGLVDLASAGRLPLDDIVSHFIELDQIPEAFERLRRGEGNRSVIVIDPELAGVAGRRTAPIRPLVEGADREPAVATFDYDGLIGEGWSGTDPDGAHVNVVLAERGTATAAALLTTFTSPAPGHAPILVVVGEDKAHYEPVWPPTIMINKETALEPLPSEDHLGRRPARDRPGRARRGRRGPDPVQRRPDRVRRDLHRPRRQRRDRGPRRQPGGDAEGRAHRASGPRRRRAGAGRAPRHGHQPVLLRQLTADADHRRSACSA